MNRLGSSEVIWFTGLVAWYIIRYPFERKARKVATIKSFFGRREWGLLALAFAGLWIIPGIYVLTGLPRLIDRPVVPWIAYLGVAVLCGALALFYRSHRDLGRNAPTRNGGRVPADPASHVLVIFPAGACTTIAYAELVRWHIWAGWCWPLVRVPDSAGRRHDARTFRCGLSRLHG
jgi:hypothetical protein